MSTPSSTRTGWLRIYRAALPPKGLAARGEFIARDETLVEIGADSQVRAFCGHVDLGTGIATSLAQIIADELDARPGQVRMVLGHTDETPDQGATIASETIQVTSRPLRKAAAQARRLLLERAAELTQRPVEDLSFRDGELVCEPSLARGPMTLGDLVAGVETRVLLDETVLVKKPSEYRVVGSEMPRVDIPDKVTGQAVYVHDVRVEGMLHARVVRPPYDGYDHGPFVARSLLSVDRASVADIPGVVDVVVIGDFVGVVAEREEQAVEAASRLKVEWAPVALPDLSDPMEAIRSNPYEPRVVLDRGQVDAELDTLAHRLDREYHWPYQMHGSIGPSCSVARWVDGQLTVWSGTQNPHMLRADLAVLMGMSIADIHVIRHEAAGCYGRNCADDVGGDAALLARAVGRPVRVQLSREQEHVWEPKGAAQLISIRGGLDGQGNPVAYDLDTSYPSNVSPLLALVLTGIVPAAVPPVAQMGDRTSIPPYDYANARITVKDMPPIARASWFRGVSAMPNSFAHDSYIDELAAQAGVDPIEYRLRHLPDQRAAELLRATADRAGWVTRSGPVSPDLSARVLRGRGAAYAQYVHGTFPGMPAAWSAWIADVEVDRLTGLVTVTRAVVGQDAGLMINPAGVRHQLHGNVIQSTSRALTEEVRFDGQGVESREWGGYPLITFPDIPEIDPVLMKRDDQPPMGAGESTSVPSAAAIANALYDATGVRFRDVPFTPEKVKARLDEALGPVQAGSRQPLPALHARGEAPRPAMAGNGWWNRMRTGGLAVAFAAAGGALATLSPWRPAIAPVEPPDPALFSSAAVARGAQVAAAGDCAVCHTAPGGVTNAGGFALETPFGIIHTTNLTPDPETGLGRWSYEAFARAMRHGISRDGHHLYPAFPYTAFAKTSENDMQALYAYIMSQKPVRNEIPQTRLKFPYNLRFTLAGWNTMFHDPAPFTPDPARSAQWNRGAYLVEGLGHCSACHSPRNALGAERWRKSYLAGGEAEGWTAPALSALSTSPLPWSEADLYDYLRTGYSRNHGPAGGPMAPVVHAMTALPDDDVKAIAHYVASFDTREADQAVQTRREAVLAQTRERQDVTRGEGARLYQGACAACHEGEGAHLFGTRPQLALNSNIWADSPDNLIRILLDGVPAPVHSAQTVMPAYRNLMSDRQLAQLIGYLRDTVAAGKPAWTDLEAAIARIRAQGAVGH
ncbi:molybdopterin cofactor-binding domain-containing protein [Komagataeibacter sp. FNDCF1]|uniref:molybdopterin cofactor-binding domain-containing protein n=1 Tax=Komagataeibacter sp. FNDCF1 TaxID=2878681 RepID=UPI001E355F05|nr:molybdopterin cofactor-binding domain-containing protein [Komagataeibacter sp. FNDCF1]MCE2563281.1 molybdopterin-dependent oxidoreductase [Komagataeibacter sp. FNDCF1]